MCVSHVPLILCTEVCVYLIPTYIHEPACLSLCFSVGNSHIHTYTPTRCVCREALRDLEALLRDDADHLRKAQQVH